MFQLAYQAIECLIKVAISAGRNTLTNLTTSNYNLSLSNSSKNTLSNNTTQKAFSVRKNRFHNLKINKFTKDYEFRGIFLNYY